MRYIFFVAIALCSFGCGGDSAPSGPVRTLHKVSADRVFSAENREDKFVAILRGSDTLDAQVYVRIMQVPRNDIYLDSFPVEALLDSGLMPASDGVVDDATRKQYIISRLDDLFDGDNFIRPASQLIELDGKQLEDEAIVDELQSRPRAVAFFYPTEKDRNRYIVFSEAKEGVIRLHE